MDNNFFVNDIVENTRDHSLYRILWISPDGAYGFWIHLNPGRMPESFECGWLDEQIEALSYEKEEDDLYICRDESTASDKARARRDELWSALESALQDEPAIFDIHMRKVLLKEPSEKLGISYTNLYPYLRLYWTKGKTPNAFLPDYRRCGVGSSDSGKKRGKPAGGRDSFGKVLDESDLKNFTSAVNKYYLTRKKATLSSAYDKLLSDSYSRPDPDHEGKYTLLPPDQIPSIRQFRYWFEKSYDLTEIKKKRDGDAKFELTGRAINGRSDYQLMGPGARYQIDATVGDIYLVSQFDRRDIIGRPVIYFVIDCYSRMVTGMYVGLEGPSWTGAMMAIENAASDKVAYCASYGIEITEDEWPCHHLPAAILGDRGEMESRLADKLVNDLGIRIENAPPYRADMKGIIEQHFRTVNTDATPFLPGKVLPDMKERGGHDYRLDAKLDIRQFTEIIIRCVLYYNNSHYMDYYEKSEQMMQIGVDPIPVELWNFGIRYCSGCLKSVPPEAIRQALMPEDHASITARGVRFRGLYYSSREALERLWFEKARSKGSYRTRVTYDPRDMGAVFVEDPVSREMVRCELVDWDSKYAGKQYDEIAYEQEKEQASRKKGKLAEAEAKVNLNKDIESIVGAAEKMADKGKRSKSDSVKNIRKNRKNEREEIRKQESYVHKESGGSEAIPKAAKADEELSPVMRMIQEEVEEEIKDDDLYRESKISGPDHPGVSGEPAD